MKFKFNGHWLPGEGDIISLKCLRLMFPEKFGTKTAMREIRAIINRAGDEVQDVINWQSDGRQNRKAAIFLREYAEFRATMSIFSRGSEIINKKTLREREESFRGILYKRRLKCKE